MTQQVQPGAEATPIASTLETRLAALEGVVRGVLDRLDAEAKRRADLQRVAYVLGGTIAGAVGEALRGFVDAGGASDALRALFGG